MIGFLVLLFPVVLLGFMLFMQRVEDPLRRVPPERHVESLLERATPAELDVVVREGTDSALRRISQRLRFRRRRRPRR